MINSKLTFFGQSHSLFYSLVNKKNYIVTTQAGKANSAVTFLLDKTACRCEESDGPTKHWHLPKMLKPCWVKQTPTPSGHNDI